MNIPSSVETEIEVFNYQYACIDPLICIYTYAEYRWACFWCIMNQ